MRSNNPVLSRRGAFSGGGYATFNTAPSAHELEEMYAAPAAVATRRMTIDDVVAKTALTLLTVAGVGAATWVVLPPTSFGIPLVAGLVGFGLAMFITFKRKISPPLILTYAVAQGVFIGGISHIFNVMYPGIVVQAVLGTAAAFAGMLIAYKSGKIRVTPRFTKILIGATMGFLLLAVTNMLLSVFGVGGGEGLGLRSDSPLGLLFGVAGVVLASLFLALDFHYVEQAVQHGAPAKEAWLAAFGLTVTLVWLYIEMLRVIAILRGDD
ncbi:MAG: Bax inhibitor-1/YccA family protein [Streptomycetales bacterium]